MADQDDNTTTPTQADVTGSDGGDDVTPSSGEGDGTLAHTGNCLEGPCAFNNSCCRGPLYREAKQSHADMVKQMERGAAAAKYAQSAAQMIQPALDKYEEAKKEVMEATRDASEEMFLHMKSVLDPFAISEEGRVEIMKALRDVANEMIQDTKNILEPNGDEPDESANEHIHEETEDVEEPQSDDSDGAESDEDADEDMDEEAEDVEKPRSDGADAESVEDADEDMEEEAEDVTDQENDVETEGDSDAEKKGSPALRAANVRMKLANEKLTEAAHALQAITAAAEASTEEMKDATTSFQAIKERFERTMDEHRERTRAHGEMRGHRCINALVHDDVSDAEP